MGTGEAKIHGKTIHGTTPVLQPDHSGFFVSPTSLTDRSVTDLKDQAAYVDPLVVPFAVIPKTLLARGIAMGKYGVAIDPKRHISAPFVVADGGPRVGEASPVLAHQISGLSLPPSYTRAEANKGQVGDARIVWVFFAGKPQPYDHNHPELLGQNAKAAFLQWGGPSRLDACLMEKKSH